VTCSGPTFNSPTAAGNGRWQRIQRPRTPRERNGIAGRQFGGVSRWTMQCSCLFPPDLCLLAEQDSTEVAAASNPARPISASSVSHTNMINNLTATVRPPLEWSGADHIALAKIEYLKSTSCCPCAKDSLRSRNVQPKPTDEHCDGDQCDQQGSNYSYDRLLIHARAMPSNEKLRHSR
jgi:hypothetical protein